MKTKKKKPVSKIITANTTWICPAGITNIDFSLIANTLQQISDSYVEVSAAGSCSCAKKINGTAWAWGDNTYGQLGDKTLNSKSSPILVLGSHSFVEVSAGTNFSLARKVDGGVWAWGYNYYGGLGDKSTVNKSSPLLVVGSHSFVEIAAGLYCSSARKANTGAVWSWGYNSYGSSGDNSIMRKSSPVLVVGSHSFVEIASGENHILARKLNTGAVWAWGYNASGQLGYNAITNRSSPILVVGSHSFVEIAAAGNHSLARKANTGAVWAWGKNSYGQLGNNTGESTTHKSSPVTAVGNHSFVEIAAGTNHSLARKANGQIWAWGYNSWGQLGDNTRVNRSSPVLMVGSHSFVEIAVTGGSHHFARKADDTVWAWGANTLGQLADGTLFSKSSPILIGYAPLLHTHNSRGNLTVVPNTPYSVSFDKNTLVQFGDKILGWGETLVISWLE